MVLVVFGTKMRKDAHLDEYGRHSQRMNELVKQIPGFMPFTSRTGSRSARPSGTTSGGLRRAGSTGSWPPGIRA